MDLGEDLTHPLLVYGVGVGVEEVHTQRHHALIFEPLGDFPGLVFVEGTNFSALEIEPAGDSLDEVGGDDAIGLNPEVGISVAVGHGLAGDFEDEFVAFSGDEPQAVEFALEQLVRCHGRSVADCTDVFSCDRVTKHSQHFVDAVDEPVCGVRWRRRGLGSCQSASGFVESDDVRKCSAGIDADADTWSVGRHLRPSRSRVGFVTIIPREHIR